MRLKQFVGFTGFLGGWGFSLVLCLIMSVVEFVLQLFIALILLPTGQNPLDAFQSNPPPIRYTLMEILRGKRFRFDWEPPSSDPDNLDFGVISYRETFKKDS